MEKDIEIRNLKKSEIEYFYRCVDYWYNYFKMSNWCLSKDCKHLDEPAFACFYGSVEDMNGQIILNDEWPVNKIYNFELDRVAFHEVCEMLVYPLVTLAEKRFSVTEDNVTHETHSIIRVLEHSVFKHGKR